MPDLKMLKQYIDDSGLKMSFIADELGLTPNGLRLKLNGTNEFKNSEMVIISQILNIDRVDRNHIFFGDFVENNSTKGGV